MHATKVGEIDSFSGLILDVIVLLWSWTQSYNN